MSIPKEYRDICEMLLNATEHRRVSWITQGTIYVVYFKDFRLELWSGSDETDSEFIAMGLRDPRHQNLADNWHVEEKETEEFALMKRLYDSVRRQTGKVEQRLQELRDLLKTDKQVGVRAQELLNIESAQYGVENNMKDVADILKRRIILGRIENFPVTNESLGGDPAPGSVKMLTVKYSYMGQSHTSNFREGLMISLPE
jgi:hypothetical protein